MDILDEQIIVGVDQVCMRLRSHLEQVYFIVVRLGAEHEEGGWRGRRRRMGFSTGTE